MKMTEIRVKESTFLNYATDLVNAGSGPSYTPLSSENMSYSRANSINDLRTAVIESIDIMDGAAVLGQKDAERLKKMGRAFTKQDLKAGQQMGKLGVR